MLLTAGTFLLFAIASVENRQTQYKRKAETPVPSAHILIPYCLVFLNVVRSGMVEQHEVNISYV